MVEFARFGIELIEDLILSKKETKDLVTDDVYRHETYYMGMVDERNRLNFYEGQIKVVNQDGEEMARFEPQHYLDHIGEHVEPWSYLEFPYLKAVGWKGLVDGKESGVYRVNFSGPAQCCRGNGNSPGSGGV